MKAAGAPDFDDRFRTLFVPAYRLALRILGSPEDAQDAAAEALARALAQWRRVSTLPYLDAWVLRVTSNVALDMVRRRRPVADTGAVAAALAEVVAVGAEPSERVILREALGSLSRRQLEVVVLRYLADLPEGDVAAALGISTGSVKQHASRGLQRLRHLLIDTSEVRHVHA